MDKKKMHTDSLHENQKFGADLDFSAVEAYNLLKTNVSFSMNIEKGKAAVIGITSPSPQEGKSYTSINYSYSLAADGYKVLLIDSDMRRPSIGHSLKHKSKPGLSELLVTKVENPDDVIVKGLLHDNLSILFSGSIPPNASKLVRSLEMEKLLEEFRKQYDYIIVDLPPVNSVSDAIGISKYLDGIIVVIKHSYTRKRDLLEALRQLKFVEANILGVVYNSYSREGSYYYKKHHYYKYYRKNYYYNSDYYREEETEETNSEDSNINENKQY